MMQFRLSSRGHPRTKGCDTGSFKLSILRAYVQLTAVLDRASGAKTATLVRFGLVEVGLSELTQVEDAVTRFPPYWLEVYSHSTGITLDSYGYFTLDKPVLAAAADLICAAERIAAPVAGAHCFAAATLMEPQGSAGVRP
ncbi:hypothetical protein [Microvirga calopogonii]|uniref:hypothetical protein n=1 Tax=Microvirga calopogonii TaxID=2078013 RepID=UPI000E0DC613|nr:hypothetical protein [Microvirga calopogonii]